MKYEIDVELEVRKNTNPKTIERKAQEAIDDYAYYELEDSLCFRGSEIKTVTQ
jgi:hypothetical protein